MADNETNQGLPPVEDPVVTETNTPDPAVTDQGDATGNSDDANGGNPASTETADEGNQSAPNEYAEFTVPDDMQLDQSLLNAALPVFKELKLTQEQAQALVDFQAAQVKSQAESFDQLVKTWGDQAKTDKEIGGDKFDESVSLGRLALSKFGTPELNKLLEDFRIGDNPEMIRFTARIGKLLKQDVPVIPGTPPSDKKDRVSLLYPNG